LSDLESAEPAGALTAKDRETLNFVLRAGGTVTASELAEQLSVEQTTAGNRLVALHKKGFLQRISRPHPSGDQFIDPRSVRLTGA
jgi:predicted transcriptional regulator